MTISSSEVRHVARLARLSFSEDDLSTLGAQLGQILDYVKQLDRLDTSGVEPTSHAVETGTPFREDVAVPFPDREALLANAPDREGDAFRVPRIIED